MKIPPFVLNPNARQRALDIIRLVETGVLCRAKFARLFNTVSIKTGEVMPLSCKSWRCKKHRPGWGYKWHNILDNLLSRRQVTLLVNLTTSEFIDHEIIHKALRMFIGRWRDEFGPSEYLRVTEYNKLHTQPHFHLLINAPDLKFPPMPEKFRQPEWKKLSYPTNVFQFIQREWRASLAYYAPGKKDTTVVWCQPPGSQVASAKYAINYITGKNSKDKDEEPDDTWRGRKMCYSKGFFDLPAREIWAAFLARQFGPPDPDDRCYWIPNEDERIFGESPLDFGTHPTMKRRYFEAVYYRDYGRWPGQADEPGQTAYFETGENGQEGFYIIEVGNFLKPAPLNTCKSGPPA